MSRDFRTMKRKMKITPQAVEAVLKENKTEEGVYDGMSERQILKEIGVYPDPDKVNDKDGSLFKHVVGALCNKVEDCCRQSEHVGRSPDMWTSYVYIPDEVLDAQKEKERRIKQKQQKFDELVNQDNRFEKQNQHEYTYKAHLQVRLWLEGDDVCVTCDAVSSGRWELDRVEDVITFLDALVGFSEATGGVNFEHSDTFVTARG